MAVRHEPVVVCLMAMLALVPLIAGLVMFNTPPAGSALVPGCPTSDSFYQPPTQLTPADPVILPKCDQYNLRAGDIEFTIDAPVDLHGSWTSTAPLGVLLFNASSPPVNGWPPTGNRNGTLDFPLFPGTYEIVFYSGVDSPGQEFVASETILANFDRGLDVVAHPAATNLSMNNFSAWPISVPVDAADVWLEGVVATDACSFVLAVLPPSVYATFLSDRSVVYSPQAVLIQSGASESCSGSPSPPTAVGFPTIGPLNISSGEFLVFYNSSSTTVDFSVLSPIEASYLLAT
jgi:hypothetical protein